MNAHDTCGDVALAVTIYQASEKIVDNIKAIAANSSKVYAYHNSSSAALSDGSALTNLGKGENLGLSVAVNSLVMRAKQDGFRWVLLLDQDTKLDPAMLPTLGSESLCSEVLAYYLMSDHRGVLPRTKFFTTSGLLVNTDLFFEAGGYAKDLFVDGLDYDFRLKACYLGKEIHLLPFLDYFDHQTLQDGVNLRLFFRNFNFRSYSRSRKREINYFYQTRIFQSIRFCELTIGFSLARSYLIFALGVIVSLVVRRSNA